MSHLRIVFGAICLLLAANARADTPILLAVEPPCAQLGTTQQITLRGFRRGDLSRAWRADHAVGHGRAVA